MNRRTLLKTLATAGGAAAWGSRISTALPPSAALQHFQLGGISDGFSQDFEQALKIMKNYGLSWVEIRKVFGVYNTEATPAQVRQLKTLLDRYGFRVSVIDSALYKCGLPGTVPVRNDKDAYPYREQMELLKRASDRAHSLGTDKIRGFTFWRVAEPGKLSARIADELGKAAEVAHHAGMRLVIENEESCNAATGHELADILGRSASPNLGANWDIGNGYWGREVSFPDGYNALDKKRIWHMHLKDIHCAKGLQSCAEVVAGHGQVDLVSQFRQLLHDGYQGTMSLECEFEAPGLTHLETTKRSLQGMIAAMNAAIAKA